MGFDQFVLAGKVTVRAGRVIIAAPATSAAGYVSDKGPLGASPDVGPGVAEGAVPVATSDIAMMGVGHGHQLPVADAARLATISVDHDVSAKSRQTNGHCELNGTGQGVSLTWGDMKGDGVRAAREIERK